MLFLEKICFDVDVGALISQVFRQVVALRCVVTMETHHVVWRCRSSITNNHRGWRRSTARGRARSASTRWGVSGNESLFELTVVELTMHFKHELIRVWHTFYKKFEQECIPVECVQPASVAISERVGLPSGMGVYLEGGLPLVWEGICPEGAQKSGRHLPPCGQNDRRLWKHYISTTTVAGNI